MTQIDVQLGTPTDVAVAVAVYERANLARRHGAWPSRAARCAQVTAQLYDSASWFLVGRDGGDAVAMAHLRPLRAGGGTGAVIAGTAFLNLIYVVPKRWGEGIGGLLLAAVIAEAARRGCHRIALWTHEDANERAQRLYERHGFARTGHTASDAAGQLIGEWLRDDEPCIRNGDT